MKKHFSIFTICFIVQVLILIADINHLAFVTGIDFLFYFNVFFSTIYIIVYSIYFLLRSSE